ncbi:MAG: CRISPR-associated helicase Cas3' [Candidatus Aenigmatarchaeota archaeon]
MVDISNILRAKSKIYGNYLLKDHIKGTIIQAKRLKDFINKNNSKISYKFDEDFFENLMIACFLHDLGKIGWRFQFSLFEKKEKEYDNKNKQYKNDELDLLYKFFNGFRNIDIKDHEVISLIYSLIFLGNEEWDKKIRTAILFHHYNEFYTNRDNINFRYVLDDYPDLYRYLNFLIKNKDKIIKILECFLKEIENIDDKTVKNVVKRLEKNINFEKIEEIKNFIENRYGTSTLLKLFDVHSKSEQEKDFYNFFVFLGCLRRCDYAASSNVDVEQEKSIDSIYSNLLEKIKKSIGENVKEIWQEKILKNLDAEDLILVSPTGSGKTEFALLWAKNRGKKLIYTLPLRVALNDLYWRFGKGKRYFEEDNLGVLHSTSYIEYLKECREGDEISIEEMLSSSELFSLPILLTTPDQVFLSSLKYYGFDKLLSVYPLSAIVVDEIQAYNPEMAAIIIKTLEIIKSVGGSILIITATYPPYFKEFLKQFKTIDVKDLIVSKKIEENEVKNYSINRHKIELIDISIFEYEKKDRNYELKINIDSFNKIVDTIMKNDSKKIMIIVNNVGKAIRLYKEIKKKFQNVYLLHSRLIEKEKSRRIEEIKQKLERNERLILVATQIVEASIDVDFDILITEISPIDSQIQRWGRIYRNREKEGNYKDKEANIKIFTGIDRGTSTIYDKRVIEKTIDVLKKMSKNEILNYEKERELIDNVFNEKIDNYTLKEIYENEIKKNLEWLKYFSAEKRSEAQRIFRRVAGIQVVVPELLKKSNDEIEKAFYEVIKEKKNWNLSWEKIIEMVKEKLSDSETKKIINKWMLLKILYMYSFNLPIFFFVENYQLRYQILEDKSLKGFFVLREGIINIEELEECGLDKIKNVDIDNEEIKQAESFENID